MFPAAKRLLLVLLLLLPLLALAAEARRPRADESAPEPRHHRHRHRHELGPRWPAGRKHDYDEGYAPADYEADYAEEEDSGEEDYDRRPAARPYAPRRAATSRRHEPRYAPRHRHRATGRGHHHRPAHRQRYEDDDSGEDYGERPGPRRRYDDESAEDEFDDEPVSPYFAQHTRKHTRSKYQPKKDWRHQGDAEDDYAYDADDEDEDYGARSRRPARRPEPERDRAPGRQSGSKLVDEWLRRTQAQPDNVSRAHDAPAFKKRRGSAPEASEEDALLRLEGELEAEEEADEDEELWKEENEELDNDFYKNDEATSLKKYDDIIRRLTDSDASTEAPKRDLRNTEIESHLKRDPYGNLRFFEPSRRPAPARYSSPEDALPAYRNLNLVDGSKRSGSKKKSLEYEVQQENNERREEAQADANMDYVEDETEEEESTPASSTSTTAASTTSTTTTTTTTTTQRPNASGRRGFESSVSTGSQYNGYQPKNDYPEMSAHSAYKWQTLGNPDSVRETRNNMSKFNRNIQSAATRAAQKNVVHVAQEGNCQWPRAKVIPVRDIHPNTSASYTPHCAILHRCSDDTGCCRSETLTCEPKHSERVELYFYATYIQGRNEIEKLSFINHTECECRERKDFSTANDRLMELRAARPYHPSPANIVRPPTKKACYCPTRFTSRITVEGQCECSCSQHDEPCFKLLVGKVILSMTDRICIQKGQCSVPSCTFGEYIMSSGKCPMKKDVIAAAANANYGHRNPSHYYRRRS